MKTLTGSAILLSDGRPFARATVVDVKPGAQIDDARFTKPKGQ